VNLFAVDEGVETAKRSSQQVNPSYGYTFRVRTEGVLWPTVSRDAFAFWGIHGKPVLRHALLGSDRGKAGIWTSNLGERIAASSGHGSAGRAPGSR
jgi:hypothetical protein